MSVQVQMTVMINHGTAGSSTFSYMAEEVGDNPIYDASLVRHAIADLAERADRATTAVYGDIGPERAQSHKYTRPLPTAAELTN